MVLGVCGQCLWTSASRAVGSPQCPASAVSQRQSRPPPAVTCPPRHHWPPLSPRSWARWPHRDVCVRRPAPRRDRSSALPAAAAPGMQRGGRGPLITSGPSAPLSREPAKRCPLGVRPHRRTGVESAGTPGPSSAGGGVGGRETLHHGGRGPSPSRAPPPPRALGSRTGAPAARPPLKPPARPLPQRQPGLRAVPGPLVWPLLGSAALGRHFNRSVVTDSATPWTVL